MVPAAAKATESATAALRQELAAAREQAREANEQRREHMLVAREAERQVALAQEEARNAEVRARKAEEAALTAQQEALQSTVDEDSKLLLEEAQANVKKLEDQIAAQEQLGRRLMELEAIAKSDAAEAVDRMNVSKAMAKEATARAEEVEEELEELRARLAGGGEASTSGAAAPSPSPSRATSFTPAEAAAMREESEALGQQVQALVMEKQSLEDELGTILERIDKAEGLSDAQAEATEVRATLLRTKEELDELREWKQARVAEDEEREREKKGGGSRRQSHDESRFTSAQAAAAAGETGPIADLDVATPCSQRDSVELVKKAMEELEELDEKHGQFTHAVEAMKRKLQARDDRDLNALDRWQLISAMNSLTDPCVEFSKRLQVLLDELRSGRAHTFRRKSMPVETLKRQLRAVQSFRGRGMKPLGEEEQE